jgi:hypothetical protein
MQPCLSHVPQICTRTLHTELRPNDHSPSAWAPLTCCHAVCGWCMSIWVLFTVCHQSLASPLPGLTFSRPRIFRLVQPIIDAKRRHESGGISSVRSRLIFLGSKPVEKRVSRRYHADVSEGGLKTTASSAPVITQRSKLRPMGRPTGLSLYNSLSATNLPPDAHTRTRSKG